MLKNFLILSLRNMRRQKVSSLINIIGLAIGLAGFIIIGLYIWDENQYDKFHTHKDRIYRINGNTFNKERVMAQLPALFYEPLVENFPEIELATRINTTHRPFPVSFEDKTIILDDILYADTTFFSIFSFPIISGSMQDFKSNPNSVFISRQTAEKYFGADNPIGKLMNFNNQADIVVAGIIENASRWSHLQYSMIINYDMLNTTNPFVFKTWGNYSANYYLLLREGTQVDELPQKMLNVFASAHNENLMDEGYFFGLQNLDDIYTGSSAIDTNLRVEAGSRAALSIFSVSAVLLLLLAVLNYVNLATARSTTRAREVGIRKVLGSGRNQLIRLFLAESLLLALLAMILAIGLVELTLPYFNQLSGKQLAFHIIPPMLRYSLLLVLPFGVALVTGIIPSLSMSAFNPVSVLKGTAYMVTASRSGIRVRQLMIVMQFAISIALISASIILYRQTSYAMSNSGFHKEGLLVLRNNSSNPPQTFMAIQNQLLQLPFITAVASGEHVPSDVIGNQGGLKHLQQDDNERKAISFATVSHSYFDILGARVLWGRNFDPEFHTDTITSVILNKSAANLLGVAEGEYPTITGFWDGNDKKVIGVVDDILYESAHRQVKPTAFFSSYGENFMRHASFTQILIRYRPEKSSAVVQATEEAWHLAAGKQPAEYFFMDSRYENMYRKELQILSIARVFTILALLIAGMGLFGTVLYVMEARRKELGVRKVLGASSLQINVMISQEFASLVALSLVLAWPLTYHFMSQWLNDFVYHITLSPIYFIGSGMAAILLALVTINSMVWRQARQNPVEALKYE